MIIFQMIMFFYPFYLSNDDFFFTFQLIFVYVHFHSQPLPA